MTSRPAAAEHLCDLARLRRVRDWIVIGSDAGPFTDRDGFAWEAV